MRMPSAAEQYRLASAMRALFEDAGREPARFDGDDVFFDFDAEDELPFAGSFEDDWDRPPIGSFGDERFRVAHALGPMSEGRIFNTGLAQTAICPAHPPELGQDWKPYEGNPHIFHCGFDGYLENREPTWDARTAECFYDEAGNLVDEDHPFAGCRGTPNAFSADFLLGIPHFAFDPGGVVWSGIPAGAESLSHYSSGLIKDHLLWRPSPDYRPAD